MIARVGGREGEAALLVAALGDDTVVLVEDFLRPVSACSLLLGIESRKSSGGDTHIDGNVDVEPVVGRPLLQLRVPLLGLVVAHHERVLGQLLDEAPRLRAVDVEEQCLGGAAQRQQGEERAHLLVLFLKARRWLSGLRR